MKSGNVSVQTDRPTGTFRSVHPLITSVQKDDSGL